MNQTSERFLTSSEVANLLGVTMQTIRLWVEKGLLRAWKTPGGHRRIPWSAVDQLLSKRQAALHEHESTLLVIEDDPDVVEIYRRAIASQGRSVQLVTANNGFDGLLQVGQAKPDAIITDLVMPDMDGFQLAKTVRGKPGLDHIPIFVVTVLTAEEIAQGGGLPKNITVFTKPSRLDQLERFLREKVLSPLTLADPHPLPHGGTL